MLELLVVLRRPELKSANLLVSARDAIICGEASGSKAGHPSQITVNFHQITTTARIGDSR
ncbi:MAG: hypothetical protein C0467_03190 [Planctomycetaceae bacterium]|nr:hypothetical protein [Planctomycetaceae bacterium]